MVSSETFESWRAELLHVGNIVQDRDANVAAEEASHRFTRYIAMLDALKGDEGLQYAKAVFESVQAEHDYGAYQTAERAALRFGEETYCHALIAELPRLIESLPDWAGDFLVSIANAQGTPHQSIISTFNTQLSESSPQTQRAVRAFIAQEEDDGWFSHRVGVLGVV